MPMIVLWEVGLYEVFNIDIKREAVKKKKTSNVITMEHTT